MVQRLFYPEEAPEEAGGEAPEKAGGEVPEKAGGEALKEKDGIIPAHAYILHPPGGLVSGDDLKMRVSLSGGAKVLITTPAAGKLYRGRESGLPQRQDFRAYLEGGTFLEYFPQETIVFSGARGEFKQSFVLDNGAGLIAWGIVCLGRPEAGESFTKGSFTDTITVFKGETLILKERLRVYGSEEPSRPGEGKATRLEGKGEGKGEGEGEGEALEGEGERRVKERALKSPLSLYSFPVYSLFLAAGGKDELKSSEVLTQALGDAREICGPKDFGGTLPKYRGATLKDGLLLVRSLGESVAAAKSFNEELWAKVRPRLLGKGPVPPRIWGT
jgi:urease accessory protein